MMIICASTSHSRMENSKIKLILQGNKAFLYDANDWISLRNSYRIIGDFMGSINAIPVLPLGLSNLEVTLLLELNLVEILKFTIDETKFPSENWQLFQHQKEMHKEKRKGQLDGIFDKILSLKRERGDLRNRNEIFNEELERSCEINADNMLWPVLLRPQESLMIYENVEFEPVSNVKYGIFKELWSRGLYVTCGLKFAGDFLVYEGDPIRFHALYIVKILRNDEKISPNELVSFGRLGTSVKKQAVLASRVDNEITYISLSWLS